MFYVVLVRVFIYIFIVYRSLFGVDDTFRQPTLSFTSRLPNALPLTDALSLRHNVLTFNAHHPVFVHLLQKHHGGMLLCMCI
jgi:hypothetical protein